MSPGLRGFRRADDETEISTDLDRIRHLPEGPLKMARFALWWIRKTAFSKPKPDNPAFFVRLGEEDVLELLGGEYFEPGWELSYSYRNETLNLRRVEYVPNHPTHPRFKWWQVHVRGYLHKSHGAAEPDTVELAAHFELEPTEYPSPHVQQVGLEIRRGALALRDILERHDVEYEYRYSDGESARVEEEPLGHATDRPSD